MSKPRTTAIIAVREINSRIEVFDTETGDVLATGSNLARGRRLRDAVLAREDEYRAARDVHFVDARAFVLHDVLPLATIIERCRPVYARD